MRRITLGTILVFKKGTTFHLCPNHCLCFGIPRMWAPPAPVNLTPPEDPQDPKALLVFIQATQTCLSLMESNYVVG